MLNLLLFLDGIRRIQALTNATCSYPILFILGLSSCVNRRLFAWRVNYLAHTVNEQGNVLTLSPKSGSQFIKSLNLFPCLEKFFTTSLNMFQQDCDIVKASVKESTLSATDAMLHSPWRSRSQISVHRLISNKRSTCNVHRLRRTDHETYHASGEDSEARLIALSICPGVLSIQLLR